MSIHVTVNADPVCIRRGGLMLSDLEQIKKYERGRRRRLRLEQVRQQSKNIASRILEQTKNIARKELHNLESHEDSKLKRMHEQKIMEIQRRYQEDMEDIGMAHEAAQSQPNPAIILKSKKLKNQITANERGKEAAKRIAEAAKIDDENEKHQERLRQVREIEDIRSSMISNLSKKHPPKQQNDPEPSTSSSPPLQSSHNLTNQQLTSKTPQQSPKKRNGKKIHGKISPSKHSPGQKIKITSKTSKKSGSPQRIQVEIHREATPELNSNEIEYVQVPCNSQCYHKNNSDLENPSTMHITSKKTDKSSRYNPSDYQNDLLISGNESSLSSLISDDSSYFSDRPTPNITAIVSENLSSSSKNYPSLTDSEIKVYDHLTRQRNSYNHPEGVVERENIKNIPNAEEMAQRIIQMENNQLNTIDNQRLIAKKRGNDAILREKVRRDYHNLMKNLDHLTREERKLKATQIINQQETNNYIDRNRRRDLNELRQRKIERAYENAQINLKTHSEAVITLDKNPKSPTNHQTECQSPPFNENNDNENELSREEQILEMLKKVERQKRLLLQEFGSTLPNNIFNATTTSLFNKTKCNDICRENLEVKQTTASPEITVINMSKLNEKKSQKGKKKVKKTPKLTPTTSQSSKIIPTSSATSEIAVQTQIELQTDKNIGEDKSIQVELSPQHLPRSTMKKTDLSSKSERPEHIEPVVTIITHSNSDISTSNSSDHGIVINVGRGRVEVTPRKSQKRVKTRSLPSSEHGSPIKRLPIAPSSSTSAPASRAATPDEIYHNSTTASSTTNVESATEIEPTNFEVNTMSTQYSRVTEVSVGTDSSHASPNEAHDTSAKPYLLPKRRIKYKETSDTSTSYASLPQITRQFHDDGIVSNITSILELVDSSGNETINRMRANISPVSTPETPSPRTMRIPSNLPNAERITRILTFDERPEVDKIHEDSQNNNARRVIRKNIIYKRADMSTCKCSNPKCKEYSEQSDNINDFEVRIHDKQLEALKRDEELQNSCTEKIASLTAMINRIRDEKSGMDFSMFAPSDDTSLMQMPEPRLTSDNGVVGLQNLVQNIEQVHDRLRQMLTESQNTFMTRRFKKEEFSLSPIGNDTVLGSEDDARRKPRIISDEQVHFDIKKIQESNAGSQAVGLEYYQSDDGSIVEKLSQEILEQSKDVEKNMQRDLAMEKTPEKSGKFGDNEGTATPGFSPILADIPKIPNKTSSTPFGNGAQRTDSKFVRPELSTIDELDTSGTMNRSQTSANRSPIKQSRQQTPRQSNIQHQYQQKPSPTVKNSSTSTRKLPKTDKHTSPISILKDSSQHENQHGGDTGENLPIEKSVKSPDSFLTHYSTRNIGAGDFFNKINIKNEITEYETQIKCEKITSSSSNNASAFSGISEILTSTSLDSIIASPPENMEFQLKKLGLSWLIPIAKKTRKASALSSSSNSDTTLTINKRTKSSVKKFHDGISCAYLDFSDVSSISIREASKSTEKTVLMKARTSTPNIPNFYCTTDKSNLTTTSTTSGKSLQHDYSDSLVSKTLAIH